MNRTTRALAAASLLIGLAALPACSKDDKQTNPTLELNSGDIGAGLTFVHTFNAAGTFAYHCSRHPTMTGSVTVNASGPAAATVSIGDVSAGFNPTPVTVGVGGAVTWTNNDTQLHTVTSN